MTFEQWFEEEFGVHPDHDNGLESANITSIARRAWHQGLARGYDCVFDSVLRERVMMELENETF